jgi:hypothetical protein
MAHHGLGTALDTLACRIGGHVWVRQVEDAPEGVLVCTRCQARDDTDVASVHPQVQPHESLVPESRPWLEPPYEAPFA